MGGGTSAGLGAASRFTHTGTSPPGKVRSSDCETKLSNGWPFWIWPEMRWAVAASARTMRLMWARSGLVYWALFWA